MRREGRMEGRGREGVREGERERGREGERDRGREGQRDRGTEGQRDRGTEIGLACGARACACV